MKRSIYLLLLFVMSFMSIELIAQRTYKIIDKDTNDPVSFAIVKVVGSDILFEANVDGIIHMPVDNNLQYVFTRLAYNPLKLSGNQITNCEIVTMEALPVEISPITVTANDAWNSLDKAIKNTFNSIPQSSFYLKCYQHDLAERRNITIADARATYVSEVSSLYKQGKGCKSTSKLKELKVNFYNNYTTDSIKRFSYYQVPFINDFFIGTRKYDKDVSFYYIDINDTIIIVGYSPKLKFKPTKDYIITSGRFLIRKKDWKIIRIYSDLSPRMIQYQNSKVIADPTRQVLLEKFSRSVDFTENGIPSVLKEEMTYTLKYDESKSLWMNSIFHVYEEISKKDYLTIPNKKGEKKSIIFQKQTLN